MIEVLISLNEKGYISNEDSTPIFEGDEAHEAWRSDYLKGRRVVLGPVMALYWKHVNGAFATFTLSDNYPPVIGTMPLTLQGMAKASAIDGSNFVVCGGQRTFIKTLPFADMITLAYVPKDSGREKILIPELPLHRVKWFPMRDEHGVWVFRGLNRHLVSNEEGVSGDGAIELPFKIVSHP